MKRLLEKTPTLAWIFIFVIGIIVIIGSMIGTVFLLATVPGFASMIFLLIALAYVLSPVENITQDVSFKIFQAGAITFFALMGMAIDQTGNFLYNYPLRYLCPQGTTLNRMVQVSHPLPGRTDLNQNFSCIDEGGKEKKAIGVGYMIALRFVEYVIIAYLFIFLRSLRRQRVHK